MHNTGIRQREKLFFMIIITLLQLLIVFPKREGTR
jgi:hypothetical protein